jgi:UDP-N-acetylglucosamine-lysosomal-enzyme
MRRRALEERAIRRNNPRGRRLLDNYGESLKHVNKLLNEEFGPAARRVPAHMPHYLQKDILNKMQAKWPEQFERTSSHQLRAPDDMQYAFSHMYFMMHERREYNFTKLFHEELDSDKDGYELEGSFFFSLLCVVL